MPLLYSSHHHDVAEMAGYRMHNLPEDLIFWILDFVMPLSNSDPLVYMCEHDTAFFYSLMLLNKHWKKTIEQHRGYTVGFFGNVNDAKKWLSDASRRNRRIFAFGFAVDSKKHLSLFSSMLESLFSDIVYNQFLLVFVSGRTKYEQIPLLRILKTRYLGIGSCLNSELMLNFGDIHQNKWLKTHLKGLELDEILFENVPNERCFEALQRLVIRDCYELDELCKLISCHPTIDYLLFRNAVGDFYSETPVFPELSNIKALIVGAEFEDYIGGEVDGERSRQLWRKTTSLKSLEIWYDSCGSIESLSDIPDTLEAISFKRILLEVYDIGPSDEVFDSDNVIFNETLLSEKLGRLRTFQIHDCRSPLFARTFNEGFYDLLFPRLELLDLCVVGENEEPIPCESFIRFKNCHPNCHVVWTKDGTSEGKRLEIL